MRRKLEEIQKIGSTAVFLPYNQTFGMTRPALPEPAANKTTSE